MDNLDSLSIKSYADFGIWNSIKIRCKSGTQIIPAHSGDFFPETPENYLNILKNDCIHDWPARLDIDITNSCNHECFFCFSKTYRTSFPKDSIKFHLFTKLIKEMVDKGTFSIRFCGGGEPLMHPDAYNIFKFCLKLPIHITLLTNGDLFSEKYQRIFIRPFIHLRFSLDSYDDKSRAELHGTNLNSFNLFVKNVERYNHERCKAGIEQFTKVGVTYLLHHLNIAGICYTTKMMKNIGVDYIAFRVIKGDNSLKFTEEELKNISMNIKKAKDEYEDGKFKIFFPRNFHKTISPPHALFNKCLVSRVRVMIEANGNVQMCPKARGEISWRTLGNVNKENSFVKIWNVKKRAAQLKRAPKECKECLDYSSNKALNHLLKRLHSEKLFNLERVWI